MHWVAIGVAVLAAVAIIVLGLMYLFTLRTATPSFGLPFPEKRPNITWWLRLKGLRDIVSGLILLATIIWGTTEMLAIAALIPTGDMSLILAAKGSKAKAFGIHGLTAALMFLAAIPLATRLV